MHSGQLQARHFVHSKKRKWELTQPNRKTGIDHPRAKSYSSSLIVWWLSPPHVVYFCFDLSLLVVVEVLLFPLCSRCESVSTGWLGQSTVCKETWQHGSSCYFVFQLLSFLDATRLRFGPTDRDLHCWFHDSENRTRVSLCDFDQKFWDRRKAQQTKVTLDKVNSNWSGCRDAACSWRVVVDEGSWWSVVEIEERPGRGPM